MTKILISLIMPLFLLSGCSLNRNEEFNVSEILSKQDGYYVYKTSDGLCHPLSVPDEGLGDVLNKAANGTEIGLLYSKTKLFNVPVLTDKDSLILKSETELSSVIPLVPLTDGGMTIGIKITKDDKGNFVIPNRSGSVATDSSAEEAYAETLGLGNYRIMSVGGESLNDYNLEASGTLKDCTEDKLYEVVLFKGTIEKKDMLKADTKVLIAGRKKVGKVETVDYTEDGFAILNLGDIQPGYYYLESLSTLYESGGVFYYAG